MSVRNNTETSQSLIEGISKGDQAAWVRFIEYYRPMVLRRCKDFGLSAEDSDCMAQDLFFQLFQRVDAFNRQRAGSFRRWLRLVLQSRIIDSLRKRKLPLEDRDLDFVACVLPASSAETSENSNQVKQTIETIRTQFSDREWTIFYLTVGEERPAKEVAAELGISENSVYLTKSRMLKRLRRRD